MRYLVIYISIIFIYSCSEAPPPIIQINHQKLFLAKETDMRKDSFITLRHLEERTNLRFSMCGMYGCSDITEFVVNNQIQLSKLPSQMLEQAGVYSIRASLNGNVLDRTKLIIPTGSMAGSSTTFTGPKTNSFNDREGSMITGYFQDQHKNLVDTNLVLHYHIQGPSSKSIQSVLTDHRYYFKHVIEAKNNSKQVVGIEADQQYSPEILIKGNSGCPSEANLYFKHVYPFADGRQIFQLAVDQILDADNHEVADGSYLEATFKSKHNQSTYFGQIVNGRSTFTIRNPQTPGHYKITVKACNKIIAQSLPLKFKSLVEEIPFNLDNENITIGPLLGQLHQMIPDGTEVWVTINEAVKIKRLSKEGFVFIALEELTQLSTPYDMSIAINGVEKRLIVDSNLYQ